MLGQGLGARSGIGSLPVISRDEAFTRPWLCVSQFSHHLFRFRISYPLYWYKNNFVTYGIVTFDVVFLLFPSFCQRWYHSPFILYPLTAILSVALFFKQSITNIIAVLVAVRLLAVSFFPGGYCTLSSIAGSSLCYPAGNVCSCLVFLLEWLPYIANLNLFSKY